LAVNHGHTYVVVLEPGAPGVEDLAGYLARRYPHSTRPQWETRIASGAVRLRGRTLTWTRPPWAEPEAPECFAVLHRDGELLAVAKPAGLPTLPGAGFLERTLLSLVRAFDPEARPLHRLGRFTSGVVLFARTREGRAHLARQFASRTVGKRYRALATGTPPAETFAVSAPIGAVPHPLLGSVHGACPGGREARTAVTVLERREGLFLCEARIETGRPHQIRIHLAAAGHPLAGDPLYGPGGVPAPGTRALPGDPGYALHALELRVVHPRTGREVVFSCAPPPPLRTGKEA
jgi:23S rRNA pseudouridine1911/1915/1917 synthase